MNKTWLSAKAFQSSQPPIAAFGEALLEIGKTNPNVLAVSTDSSSGSGLSPFQAAFPERHIEFGIMEQGAMGYCSGLATTGKVPFFAAIAPFVTARSFEMFKDDLGYMEQNVKVVGRCCGITYSQLGPTHHSIDDYAMLRTIPGLSIVSPGDPVTIKKAAKALAELTGPAYLRIGSPPMPLLYDEDVPFELGKGLLVQEGKDICLVGSGTALANTVKAARLLEEKGISVRVIDLHTIKPLDGDILLKAAEEIGRIVTVEEHFTFGGLGGAVAEFLAQRRPTPMKLIGIQDEFVSNGPYEELLGKYGLLPRQIAAAAEAFLETRF